MPQEWSQVVKPLIIDSTTFGNYSWLDRHPKDDRFVQEEPLIPLYAREVDQASAAMPIAVIRTPVGWDLVAVCGVKPGQNAFVSNGIWGAVYRPVWLEMYPFFAAADGEGTLSFWFDTDSGLLCNKGEGYPFYDDSGEQSIVLQERLSMLGERVVMYRETRSLLQALWELGMIIPWPDYLQNDLSPAMPPLYTVNRVGAQALSSENSILRHAGTFADNLQKSLNQLSPLTQRASYRHYSSTRKLHF